MEFGNLLAAVATGKVDLVVSTLVITEERERKVDFSEPYYSLGASVFALTRNIASPATAQPESPRPAFRQRLLESRVELCALRRKPSFFQAHELFRKSLLDRTAPVGKHSGFHEPVEPLQGLAVHGNADLRDSHLHHLWYDIISYPS
jgi:ABC-type amino acid transport substrate-binding protein